MGGGASAVTDADGRYRLRVPSPGIYNVWLKEFGTDSSKTAAADDGILVEAGKAASSELHLVDGRKVTGKVVDADGIPFAGLTVNCHSPARPPSGGVQSAKTNADGAFEFFLPPGRAYVYAVESVGRTDDDPFGAGRSAHAHITVPPTGVVAPLKLTLQKSEARFGDDGWLIQSTPGTRVVRREAREAVTGAVVDGDGKPVARARVFRYDGPLVPADERGEFRVDAPKGTQFVMHAWAPGYHVWFGTPTSGDVLRVVLEPKPKSADPDWPKREPTGARPSGTLTGRFVFDGEPPAVTDLAPELTKIDPARPQVPGPDGRFSGVEAVYREFLSHGIRPKTDDPSLLVGKDGGVANVVVWVAGKDIPWATPGEWRAVTIRLKDGNYTPRVVVATAGQPLLLENHDPVRFNFHLTLARNDGTNMLLAPRSAEKPLRLTLPTAESVPAPYRSDQGPWATGWLFVHATPFVAVSGADGSFTLTDLPPGEWEFRVWHERQGYLKHWPRGTFKYAVRPGVNSLGVIKIKPECFRR
jgi:protocatechuate 3,4-dioxygenase beta subunit